MDMRAPLLLALVGTCAAQGPNLLVNGSFESGPGTTTNTTVYSPSAAFPGWFVFAGSVDQVAEWTAANGSYCIDLDGLSPGGIRQTVATTPGVMYELSFRMAGNTGGPLVKTMRVTVGSTQSVQSFDTSNSTSTSMGWSLRSIIVVGVAPSTTIEFLSLSTSGSTGPAIDDVVFHELGSGPSFFTTFGSGCTGTSGIPEQLANQPPRIGQPFSVLLHNLPANEIAAAMVSFDASHYPLAAYELAPLGMPGCPLYAVPQIIDVIPSTGIFGSYIWGVVLPNNLAAVGTVFILQFLVHDLGANAGGFVTSNAALAVVGA